jgi:hypothetical protein
MQMTEPDDVVHCKKNSGKPYYYSNLNLERVVYSLEGKRAKGTHFKIGRDGSTASVTAVACDNQRESARPVSAGVYTVPLGAICFPHSPHSSTTTTMSITKIYARQESFFLSVPVAITCP